MDFLPLNLREQEREREREWGAEPLSMAQNNYWQDGLMCSGQLQQRKSSVALFSFRGLWNNIFWGQCTYHKCLLSCRSPNGATEASLALCSYQSPHRNKPSGSTPHYTRADVRFQHTAHAHLCSFFVVIYGGLTSAPVCRRVCFSWANFMDSSQAVRGKSKRSTSKFHHGEFSRETERGGQRAALLISALMGKMHYCAHQRLSQGCMENNCSEMCEFSSTRWLRDNLPLSNLTAAEMVNCCFSYCNGKAAETF